MDKERNLQLGMGYHLKRIADRKVIKISIPASHRTSHMWVFGTTRVGKTKLLESIIEQDIPAGLSVVIIDPKGDDGLFSKVVQVAKKCGRLSDLMLFTPIFPECSVHFNPLKHFYMIEEQVAHIISGIAAGKEPFFKNVAYEVTLALVMTDNLIRGYATDNSNTLTPFSLINVLNEMSHEKIGKLIGKVSSYNTPEATQLSANLEKIYQSGQDYYNKVSSSLRVALMELCNGNIGEVIGKTSTNKFIDRIEEGKPTIFVVQLGSMLTRQAAQTAGKVILSSIQALVGRKQASGKKLYPPLTVHIDEAQSVLYQGIDELFAKGGSADLLLHGYCQSVSQMYKEVNKDYAHSILDNCNTKIFLRVSDAITSKFVSDHFGMKGGFSPMLNGSGSMGFRQADVESVKAKEVMDLDPRRFYMLGYGGNYYGMTNTVSKQTLKIKFPESKLENDSNTA